MKILLLISMLVVAGVTVTNGEIVLPDRQYRFCTPGGSPAKGQCNEAFCARLKVSGKACNPPNSLQQPEVNEGTSSTGTQWKIAFLEYDDHGKRWDLAQRAIAKAIIEDARKDGDPATLIMYVHGWQNNAYNSGDVTKFEDYVKTYSEHVAAGSPRRIIGVYLAWHGRSLNIAPFLDWLSFWTRGITAGIVGTGDLRQDVNCLVGWGKEPLSNGRLSECGALRLEEAPPPPLEPGPVDPSTQNRVILKGHSFGGRILDHALLSKSNKGTVQAKECATLESKRAVLSQIDLLMLENAATGGVNVWRQLETCQPCKDEKNGCKDFKADSADYSKSVMARAPAFEGVKGGMGPCSTAVSLEPRCQPYPLVLSVSGKMDFLTRLVLPIATFGQVPASFLVPLQTHQAVALDAARKPDVTKGELFQFQSESGTWFMFQRKPPGRFAATNPVWTLDVDGKIIKDHGDVWNKSVLNLEMNLMNFGDPTHSAENKAAVSKERIEYIPRKTLETKKN